MKPPVVLKSRGDQFKSFPSTKEFIQNQYLEYLDNRKGVLMQMIADPSIYGPNLRQVLENAKTQLTEILQYERDANNYCYEDQPDTKTYNESIKEKSGRDGIFCPRCGTFNTHDECGTYIALTPTCKSCKGSTELLINS